MGAGVSGLFPSEVAIGVLGPEGRIDAPEQPGRGQALRSMMPTTSLVHSSNELLS